ncbi:MAG: type II toxin-antitoxin system death-on-curing family toxin [Cyanobacteria bacterium P01_G01_bin.54]
MRTPEFITLEQVLRLHDDQITDFGGTRGIRDQGLLASAIAQPQAMFGGQLLHPTLAEQAAAYLYHLVLNHPFIDGNKRTAFAVMDTFLRLNGYQLTLSDREAYELVLAVATHQMSKAELSQMLSEAIAS